MWTGNSGGFVLTSSASVYAEEDGGIVTEGSAVSSAPRAATLLAAEKLVTGAGGTVVRLAGLYLLERGAHNAYLKTDVVSGRPDGLINQVHYRDAASAVVAALMSGGKGNTLLVADEAPLTRERICEVARLAPVFQDRPMPRFKDTGQGRSGIGKVLDCSDTKAKLQWQPLHTFETFMLGQQ
jgi:nucleoside-diphosphate-sugar epimerase